MRACLIVEHGRPPIVGDAPEPVADGPGMLVEVSAAPITPLDLLAASGTSYFGPPALPYVPGVQGVGRVVGEPSRRVWFTTDAGMQPGDGSMAERCFVPADRAWDIPVEVDDALVAGLGLSAVAASGALTRGRFVPGERVLILGAGGVVGRVALQLARAGGAGLVVAACRGQAAAARAMELGADVAVDIAGLEDQALASALAAAAPEGIDLVVDPVWGAPARAAVATLAPGGRLVNLGDAAGADALLSSAVIRSRSIEILGYTNLSQTWAEQTRAMDRILRLAASGEMTADIDVVGLSDAGDGWERQGSGRVTGRVVVDPRR